MDELAKAEFCYLTTTGRVSGRQHTIEIWFALHESTALLLAGNHESDWVKNIAAHPAVALRIGALRYAGQGRIVVDAAEIERARTLVFEKYQPGSDDDLRAWRDRALPVAIALDMHAPLVD